jgi:Uncharacterised nucleotidyltransferase
MRGGLRTSQSGLFWPSELQQELLVVALGEPVDAISAWRRLQPRFVLDELEPGSFDLMALGYYQLSAGGYRDPVVERMKSIYRREWVRANVLRKLTTEVATMLDEIGVRALFIEGATLADRFFPAPEVRPSWSIDVFVEEKAAGPALAGLANAGWSRAPWSANADAGGPWGLINGERGVCSVRASFSRDLVAPGEPARPYEAMWETAELLTLDGTELLVAEPLWTLLSVCVGGARLREPTNLQWIVDAVMILRAAEIDFSRLAETARSRGQTVRLREALAYLGEFPGVEIPGGTIAALDAAPVSARERLAYSLAAGSFSSAGSLTEHVADHLAVTADRPLTRVVASFPAYLRDRWDVPHGWDLPVEAGRRALRHARAPRRPA